MRFYRYLLAAGLAAAILAAGALAATPPNGAASYKGVDIYHGSNVLSFTALKASGHADFAWVKSSEGEHTADNKFTDYAAGCQAAGIKWGPYHYVKFYSIASAKKQADFFWSRIKGTNYTVLPAADIEEYTFKSNTSADIRAMTVAFFTEFKRLSGYYPVLYTCTDFCNNNFPNGAGLSGVKLWLADYRGYAGNVSGWTKYDAWQYSGDKDHVAGIDNAADLDVGTASIFTTPASKSTTATTAAKPAAKPAKPAWPGYAAFGWGRSNNYILTLDRALISAGYSRYYYYGTRGASTSWGLGTQRACAAFQRTQGWSGLGADGVPGAVTWKRLQKYM